MSLASLIQTAREQGAANIAEIVAALNLPGQSVEVAVETVQKPSERIEAEMLLRGVLNNLAVPAPIPEGTLQALLSRSYTTVAATANLARAVALYNELTGVHGLSLADFRAEHFGAASYERTVPRTVYAASAAEAALGRAVTYQEVEAAILLQNQTSNGES